MSASTVRERLSDARVLPALAITAADTAGVIAQTLGDSGLGCVEITFRTAAAEAAIAHASALPGLCVGAGTVRSPDQARAAAAAGARFIVTPGTNPAVIETCHELGLPVFPGVATPTEVERAMELGCTVLKLFPAAVLGGPGMLRALAPVYPDAAFIPTGGVTEANADEYLRLGNVLAVAGTWIAAGDLSTPEGLRELGARARRARALADAARANNAAGG